MGGDTFGDMGGTDSSNSPLNAAGVQVMPLDRVGAGVYGEITGGEKVLPFPGCCCSGIFSGQGLGHGDGDIRVSVVEAAHLPKVYAEALAELFLVGQEGHPVAVGLVSRTVMSAFSKSRSWMRRRKASRRRRPLP